MKQVLKKAIIKKYFFNVLICLGIIFGIGVFGVLANVQISGDTKLILSGVPEGSLYIAAGSEIVSMNVVGSTLTVDNIPAGSNFILKTPQHTNSLKIGSATGTPGLIFEGGNLSSGNITKWVLTGTGALTVNYIVGTPLANTDYIVKVDNVAFGTYKSSASSEIIFIYNGTFSSPKTFTIEGSGVNPTPTPTPTPGPAVPSIPLALTSISSNSSVTLSWLTPSSNGSSAITNYKVYRSTSSNTETFLANSATLSYTDSNVTNGIIYYYQVTALNSIGESLKSNETIANPQATRIQGTVSNSSNTPILGATITAGSTSTTTNASGFYSLFVPAGTYTITASSSLYSSQSKPASVSAAQTTTVNFTLTQSDTTPPVRSNATPTGTLATGTTQTNLTLTTSEIATCKYSTSPNTSYAAMTNTFTTTNSTSHSQALSNLANGISYNYYIRCQDTASNPNIDDLVISFSVANVPPPPPLPPSRSHGSPSGILSTGTTEINLTLTTNIAATCKYFTSPSTTYALMPNTFTSTNSTSHTTSVSNLSKGQSYSYYIKCQANSIANSDDYVISFSVANPPAATPGGGDPSNPSGQEGGSFDTIPPSKVSNLTASPTASQALFTWINPTDGDYQKTKILRKENSYPASLSDSTVVFDDNKNSFIDSNLKSGTTYYYSVYTYDTSNNYSQASQATIVTKGTQSQGNSSYPDSTLLKTSDSPKVYVIIQGKKKWISTPEVFETLGYKWTNITITDQSVLSAITDYEDNLIRANGDYKVWLVTNGIRHHVPNPEIFLDYGFAWTDVKDVPQATIDQYRLARLIRESRQGTIYYLSPAGIKKWIPNPEIFTSYNNSWNDIQVISKKEMDSYLVSNLMSYDGKVYLISGTTKRLIPNETILKRYDASLMLGANKTEFDWYKTGTNVK